MSYNIDIKKISIDQYKKKLKSAELIPSHMVLREHLDKRFKVIKQLGIHNVEELRNALKSKDQLQLFSSKSGLEEKYLKVLLRAVNAYIRKPNKIMDIPDTAKGDILRLEKLGIKNTLQLFDEIVTPKNRKELAQQTGIKEDKILRLAKLTDLSRIQWVNHTFAYVLLEAGYDTVEKVAKADPTVLYEMIKQLNKERKIFPAHIGLTDMRRLVEAAEEVPLEVKY